MTRNLSSIFALLFLSGQFGLSATVELDPATAESLLLSRPLPVYSELAQRARMQGTIKLLIRVSESGAVTEVRVLSGHPLLDEGAVNSTWQSKYKPYSPEGTAIPFITQVEVTFLPGISGKEYERDLKLAGAYFEQEAKCRDLIKSSKWPEAGETCRANLETVDKLGRHRVVPKMRAYQLAARAMLGQDKYKEALEYLNRAHSIGKTGLNDEDVDLAEVFVNLGFTYSKIGKMGNAKNFFEKGEKALQLACNRNPFLRARYIPLLKNALENHIRVAEAEGDVKEVAALQSRLASLR